MELALNEVKIQAKKLLKTVTLQGKLPPAFDKLGVTSANELKLKHCLAIVAKDLGFDSWQHACEILSGCHTPIETLNMGSFFYPIGADMFINEWFAKYQDAKSVLLKHQATKWLLPYKKQFVVVSGNYIARFNLDNELSKLWSQVNHDLVASYNSHEWDQIACAVIKNNKKTC